MKWMFLFFMSFSSYSQDCKYKGEVSPVKFQNRVKKTYKDMCEWWYRTFPSKPLRDDIVLSQVNFIKNFEGRGYPEGVGDDHSGIFWRMDKKDFNEVVVRYPPPNHTWIKGADEAIADGVLAHEIFHFFKKSCCFNTMAEVRKKKKMINGTYYEGSAYWAQDQYLKRAYGKSLFDFFLIKKEEGKECEAVLEEREDKNCEFVVENGEDKGYRDVIENFETISIYQNAGLIDLPKRVYNSTLWFAENPQERLDGLVKGRHLMYHSMYHLPY